MPRRGLPPAARPLYSGQDRSHRRQEPAGGPERILSEGEGLLQRQPPGEHWDVFQWGTTYYADKQYGWLVTKTRYEEEQLKLDVGYEIKTRLLDVREAEKRIAVASKSVAQATEAYHVALAQYQEQVGTNFDVLNASANLTAAQASLTGAKADYLTALSQLYVAMGEYRPDLMRRDAAPAPPSPAAGASGGSRASSPAPRTHP